MIFGIASFINTITQSAIKVHNYQAHNYPQANELKIG
tara:strand:- start:331 stop:441 length:111 start_codon:yes stop_codon:yes gene_type:complete